MKTIQRILFLALVFLSVQISAAQVPELIKDAQFREDARAAVDSLYNFNPVGADKKLASWEKKYPSHPLWQLMDGMAFWWTLLSDLNDTSHDDAFFKVMKKADYAAAKLLYKHLGHADALITRTVANGYIARQYSNREEWVTSLNAARKAYNSYGYLEESLPDFPDLKLAEGLKLYYSAYLPEAYPIVKSVSWFLPDGDKKEGLKYMQKASEKAIFARGEAIYFLGNINYNYEKKYREAAQYFKTLYETYPHNNYYARLLVRNYYKTGRFKEALKVINESLKEWEAKDLPFGNVLREELLFWKGRILLRSNDDKQALDLFKQSLILGNDLPRTSHRSYHTAGAYYAGKALYNMDQKEEATQYFKAVLDAKTGDEYKKLAHRQLDQM